MHVVSRTLIGIAVVAASSVNVPMASAGYDDASGGRRALYNAGAVAANILPGVSALYAPTCLPGYIVCKIAFAGVSLIAAGGQWLLSGAQDVEQTRGILHRGFAGDWYLTGRHIAGDATPQPLPDPPPPAAKSDEGSWAPPPI
jgi:hypothetical protein